MIMCDRNGHGITRHILRAPLLCDDSAHSMPIACFHLSNTVRTTALHDDGLNICMHNNDYVHTASELVIYQPPEPLLRGDQTASHLQTIRRN